MIMVVLVFMRFPLSDAHEGQRRALSRGSMTGAWPQH
jgi:hypothetical protein